MRVSLLLQYWEIMTGKPPHALLQATPLFPHPSPAIYSFTSHHTLSTRAETSQGQNTDEIYPKAALVSGLVHELTLHHRCDDLLVRQPIFLSVARKQEGIGFALCIVCTHGFKES